MAQIRQEINIIDKGGMYSIDIADKKLHYSEYEQVLTDNGWSVARPIYINPADKSGIWVKKNG